MHVLPVHRESRQFPRYWPIWVEIGCFCAFHKQEMCEKLLKQVEVNDYHQVRSFDKKDKKDKYPLNVKDGESLGVNASPGSS